MNTEENLQEVTRKSVDYSTPFTIEDLFTRNVHYGHQKNLWNPRMAPYIHSVKNNVHIINLVKSYQALMQAKNILYHAGMEHKRILFVGTKPQISKIVKEYAIECAQYYVNHKWVGGMLTNWSVINNLVKTLQKFEKIFKQNSAPGSENFKKKELFSENIQTKKEELAFTKHLDKLETVVGGMKDLSTKPDILFVIDAETEKMAIKEAKRLGIYVIAIVDTNSSPEGVDLVIPGNDDSVKAIEFYLQHVAGAILSGIRAGLLSTKSSTKSVDPANPPRVGNSKQKFSSKAFTTAKPIEKDAGNAVSSDEKALNSNPIPLS